MEVSIDARGAVDSDQEWKAGWNTPAESSQRIVQNVSRRMADVRVHHSSVVRREAIGVLASVFDRRSNGTANDTANFTNDTEDTVEERDMGLSSTGLYMVLLVAFLFLVFCLIACVMIRSQLASFFRERRIDAAAKKALLSFKDTSNNSPWEIFLAEVHVPNGAALKKAVRNLLGDEENKSKIGEILQDLREMSEVTDDDDNFASGMKTLSKDDMVKLATSVRGTIQGLSWEVPKTDADLPTCSLVVIAEDDCGWLKNEFENVFSGGKLTREDFEGLVGLIVVWTIVRTVNTARDSKFADSADTTSRKNKGKWEVSCKFYLRTRHDLEAKGSESPQRSTSSLGRGSSSTYAP